MDLLTEVWRLRLRSGDSGYGLAISRPKSGDSGYGLATPATGWLELWVQSVLTWVSLATYTARLT